MKFHSAFLEHGMFVLSDALDYESSKHGNVQRNWFGSLSLHSMMPFGFGLGAWFRNKRPFSSSAWRYWGATVSVAF